jgi:hypothetical protein
MVGLWGEDMFILLFGNCDTVSLAVTVFNGIMVMKMRFVSRRIARLYAPGRQPNSST